MSEQEMTIGFIGNPNCGNTSLRKAHTGSSLKRAKWQRVSE